MANQEKLLFTPHEYIYHLRTEVTNAEIATVRYGLTAVWDKHFPNTPTFFDITLAEDLPERLREHDTLTKAGYHPKKDRFIFFMKRLRADGIIIPEILMNAGHEGMHRVQRYQGKVLIPTRGKAYLDDEIEREARIEGYEILVAMDPELAGHEYYVGEDSCNRRIEYIPAQTSYPPHINVEIKG